MTQTYNVFTAPEQIKMKWREPYLTEGLDRKLAVALARGIYQGFRLTPSAVNLTVTVAGDPTTGLSTSVYETSDGYSLTLNAAGFDLDLAVFAGVALDPVIVAIDADYAVGVTTYANISVYSQTDFGLLTAAEQNEKIILGEVLVPAAGVIPAANITHNRRREAWEFMAPSARPWLPLLRNPSFEWSVDNENQPGATAYWEARVGLSHRVNFVPTSTYLTATGDRSLIVRKVGTAGAFTAAYYQRLGLPCQEGQHVKVRLSKQALIITTAGTVSVGLNLTDANGQGTTILALDLAVGAVDANWVTVEHTFVIPAGAYYIAAAGLFFNGTTIAAGGDAILFDDVQFWLEAPVNDPTLMPVWTSQLTIGTQNQSGLGLADLGAHLWFDSSDPTSEGTLYVDRRDQDPATLPPLLGLMGRLKLGQGTALAASDAVALLARLSAATVGGAVTRTLLFESSGTATITRIYLLNSAAAVLDGVEITVNARWDGALWNKDLAGTAASKWTQTSAGVLFYTRLAANDIAWTDYGSPHWDHRSNAFDVDGNLYVSATTALGAELYSTATTNAATTPRLATVLNDPATAAGPYTLLWAAGYPGLPFVRLFGAGCGAFAVTSNARLGSVSAPTDGKWNKDVVGRSASIFMTGNWPHAPLALTMDTGVIIARRILDAAWTDAEWESFPLLLLDESRLIATAGAEGIAAFKAHVKPAGVVSPIQARRTLMFEFAQPTASAAQGATRIYSTPLANGAMEITFNAAWSTALDQWVTDVAGPAGKVVFGMSLVAVTKGVCSQWLCSTPVMGASTSFNDSLFTDNCTLFTSPEAVALTAKLTGLSGENGGILVKAPPTFTVPAGASITAGFGAERLGAVCDYSRWLWDFVPPGPGGTYSSVTLTPVVAAINCVPFSPFALPTPPVGARGALVEASTVAGGNASFLEDVTFA